MNLAAGIPGQNPPLAAIGGPGHGALKGAASPARANSEYAVGKSISLFGTKYAGGTILDARFHGIPWPLTPDRCDGGISGSFRCHVVASTRYFAQYFLSMLEWNIQSRTHQCQLTGKAFAAGESYHTVLLDAKVGFERLDLCANAWKEQGAEIIQRPNFISHWMGTYETPPAAPPEAIRKDDAESLLRALMDRKDEQYAPAVFILAVMLERKRVLRAKGQMRDAGRRVLVYEHSKSGEVLMIPDPDLQLDQISTLQRDVAHLLVHGLPHDGEPIEEPFNLPSEINTLTPA